MAVLETIRVKFGVLITVLIAVALLSFIIDPSTLQSVSASMSSKYDVGEINGKSISYTDFQAELDKFTTLNEIMTGASAQNEEEQQNLRNAAWQSLVDKYLFIENANKAGLNVGEEEMVSLISGDMLSPVFSQNPAFCDKNGVFSKDLLLEFISYINSDQTGRLRLYWDYLQNSAMTQQYYAKYESLFTYSNITNPLMLTEKIADNNNTFDVEFVMAPFGYQRDTTIVVSDNEIKDYYKSHINFYKQKANRDIEYVVFEVKPSAEDVADAKSSLMDVYEEFAATENMKAFLLANSERQYDNLYYKAGELTPVSKEINDFVFGSAKATTSDVFEKNGVFSAVRVVETAKVPDSVYVRHILLQGDNVAKADSLLNVVSRNRSSFAAVAEAFSADQNTTAPEKGDIGWMTQTYMIPGLESVITATPNKPFILETQYGKHIVEVTKRTQLVEKKKVGILQKTAIAGNETINGYYAQANTFATLAGGKHGDFDAAADSVGVYAHPVNRMLESSNKLGAIDNTKEVTRWAFEAKPGDVSSIFRINNNEYFVIATVKEARKEGYADINDVASSIKNILYTQKLAEKKTAEAAQKIEGLTDLQAIATALGTTVSTKEGVAFSSLTSQGLDNKFIGAASVAEDGVICGPVAGNLGVYVYKVTGRDTGAFYTEEDAKLRDTQMAQYSAQMVLPVMMENTVTDNRARFF